MNKKIIALIVLVLVIIGLAYYVISNESSDTSSETVEVTENTKGDLDTLQSNEDIDSKIGELSEGMDKSEVHTIMDAEPIQSGELNSTEYDNYERYDFDDGYTYDIYYIGDSLYGVSAVVN